MKTVYINENGKITKWKIKRIAKKIAKINQKEMTVVAICDELSENEKLINELEIHRITILNR